VEDPAVTASRRRRPRAVTFVSSIVLVEATIVVLAGILVGAGHVAGSPVATVRPGDLFEPIVSVLPGLGLATVIVVAGGGLALAGLGLLQMREWGWVLAMALQGLGLAYALYTHLHGDPQYLALALCSFVVLVLNQREARQAFQVQAEHG
jgi:hypothetical protein